MLVSMRQQNKPAILHDLLQDSGLIACPCMYKDNWFLYSVTGGMIILWYVHDLVPAFSNSIIFDWKLVLSIILWQPFIEELLFRGIIQGQLAKLNWGRLNIFHVSVANIITSLSFVAIHMIHSSPMWALLVIFPSLLFGYFRDRYKSIYPSFIMHSAYNSIAIIGLLIHGNADLKPHFI